MTQMEISSAQSPLYAEVAASYALSFPLFEQRTPQQQSDAFADPRYHLLAWHEERRLMAYISYWDLGHCLYVEHFAVEQAQRGQGTGSEVLRQFCSQAKTAVVLEIDPPVDEVSRKRLRFYEHLGFRHNTHSHLHPAYRQEYAPHRLHIMSYPRHITAEEYGRFNLDLQHIVMKRQRQHGSAKSK